MHLTLKSQNNEIDPFLKIVGIILITGLLIYISLQLWQQRTFLLPTIDYASTNQMNKEIQTGKAPDGVTRVDNPKVQGEQRHVHFGNKAALNENGIWKHGQTQLTNKQVEWLIKHGWRLPHE